MTPVCGELRSVAAMLVGRSAETQAVDRLLADARAGGSGVLVLRGEAGIGKSALLEYAAEQAEGMAVLRGVGIESESELAFAALHQVLRPILDRIERLPAPQAAALRTAFALSDEVLAHDHRFRVSLGVLSLFADAAEERPILCLVDDAQWLDGPSADALLFTAHRLEAEPLALLFAARDDDSGAYAMPGLPELRPAALDRLEARALLTERLPTDVAPQALEWVLENAYGNPLALVELPLALTVGQLSGKDPLVSELPPITSVEGVYYERIERLAQEAQTMLVIAAAESTGDRGTISRAAGEMGISPTVLEVAEAAGLIRVHAERVEFTHPLVRSAVYRHAGFVEREHAHGALAKVLSSPQDEDQRAWHRAAATTGPAADVADELEHTAHRALLRSGPAAAASALERAAQLSVDPESEAHRLVAAADAAYHAGQFKRTTALLDRASPIAGDVLVRAKLEHLRGLVEWRSGSLFDACTILMAGAADVAALDPGRAREMLFDACTAALNIGDSSLVAEVVQRASALPQSELEEDTLLADLLVSVGSLLEGKTAGELPAAMELVARAEGIANPRRLPWAALVAIIIGADAKAESMLRRAETLAREAGEIDAVLFVLSAVMVHGNLAGRLDVAPDGVEGLRLARECGLRGTVFLALLAWFAAVKGQDEECQAYAAEVTELIVASGNGYINSIVEWALALLDLLRGRFEETMSRLVGLRTAAPGRGHPLIVLMSTSDLVEASIRCGDHKQAEAAYAVLDEFARPGAPVWALALAQRCRALLSEDAAEGHFAEALKLHAASGRLFDTARTELLLGEYLRRERRPTDAREPLRHALETFETLGAAPWADRARAELRAAGETTRKRDPSGLAELTPQELQVAQFVGRGLSNREIAAQLFLSPRTIEYHLRKVFMKLGISSRVELIGFEAERQSSAVT